MAKINGIELKAVKEFIGMDGYGFSANIYMDGKRVGIVNDEADGRCYYYFFTSKEIEKQIMERIKDFFTEHPQLDTFKIYSMEQKDIDSMFNNGGTASLPIQEYKDMIEPEDAFFSILLTLKKHEREYNKNVKNGYNILVHVERIHTHVPLLFDAVWYSNDEGLQDIIDEENEKYPYNIFHIYRSLDDFCIN